MFSFGAECLGIVWRAFIAAFSWFWSLISADNYLMEVYFGLIVIGWVVTLFVKPFFAGTWSDAPEKRKSSRSKKESAAEGD